MSSSSAATANSGGPTADPRECNATDGRKPPVPLSVPISTPQIIANIRHPIKVEKLTTLVGRSGGDSLQQHHHHRQIKTTSNSPLLNISEKVVMATQPVQVMMQQQGGANQPHVIQHQQRVNLAPTTKIITKFIVKNSSAANSSVSGGSSSGVHHVSGSNLNFKTIPIPIQKNNISVSPVKGGFKIPISPVKQQMKFSVVPSSNNIVKRVEKLQPAPVGANFQQKTGGTANFQFQTIPQGSNVVNKITPNNINSGGVVPNQTFTIQTMNQAFQASSVRAPCTVRLIPANGPVSSQPTLIPVQTAATQQGHPKIVHHQQQPFVSFQQVRPLQIKPQPRLIMPAAVAAQAAAVPQQQTPKIANLSGGTLVKTSTNNNITGYTLVPAKYVEQLKKQNYQPQYIQGQEAKVVTTTTPTPPESMSRPPPANSAPSSVINGKVHKPCNCTKSMCLKLYCECFANGHFCDGCNCINCHNNLDYDSDRSKAIRSCLDRNPYAFRPKIGRGRDDARAHQKGCNCRRSGCLKNYCECYEARIPCTSRCKCIGCKNLEGNWPASRGCRGPRIGMHHQQNHHQPLMSLADAAAARCQQQQAASSRITSQIEDMHRASTAARHSKAGASGLSNGEKQPSTFFTKEVIEASSVCMLAQAEEAEKSNHPPQISERLILEEFGRLLMQIIDAARKTKVSVSSAPNTQQQPPPT